VAGRASAGTLPATSTGCVTQGGVIVTALVTREARPDMLPTRTRPVVALFNSSDDLLELLRMLFEEHGFLAVTGHVNDLRKGTLDLQAFVAHHRPSVVLYDLIPPFERQWAFLDHLRAHSALKDLPFILMSTNERLARSLASRDEQVIEVVGRPFEFPLLLDAVKRAIGQAAA